MSEPRGISWRVLLSSIVVLVMTGVMVARHVARSAGPAAPDKTATARSPASVTPASVNEQLREETVRTEGVETEPRRGSTPANQEDIVELAPGTETEPPLMAYPGTSRDIDAQLIDILSRSAALDRDAALRAGRQLLGCTNGLLRALGSAILCQQNGLTEELMAQLARDADPLVPLTALGYLGDAGRLDEAGKLLAAWRANGLSADRLDQLAEALTAGELGTVGGRAALRVLKESYAAERFRDVLDAVARAGESLPYSLRMSAIWMEKSLVDLSVFQDQLRELARRPSSSDGAPSGPGTRRSSSSESRPSAIRKRSPMGMKPQAGGKAEGAQTLWQQGLARLSSRFDGPAEVAQSQPMMCPQYIDEAFAGPSPMMVEDVALWVEAAVTDASAKVAWGSAARIATHLKALPPGALSAEQKYAVVRIQARLDSLSAKEQNLPDIGPPSPAP